MTRKTIFCLSVLPLAMVAQAAMAQGTGDGDPFDPDASRLIPPVDLTDEELPPLEASMEPDKIVFSAQMIEYNQASDVVTASGDVHLVRDGVRLRADQVVWNRNTGEVIANGNVAVRSPEGDSAYAERAELTDTLRDGMVDNLLIVLENGGRLAAQAGARDDGVSILDNAAYTPYRALDDEGEPQEPSWYITAARVIHDPETNRIRYEDARFNLFGLTIAALPSFSHPDGSEGGSTGFLVPDFRLSRSNGLEVEFPYYINLAPNRDATITPHIYTGVLPAIEAEYRHLAAEGAFQVAGIATYSSRRPINPPAGFVFDGDNDFRGYIEANGRFQFTPYWSVTGSTRLTTDDTFLRRYDISRDDRLRSTVEAERIGENSYFSIAGWAVQDLRATADGGQQPIAIPAIDYRQRFADGLIGGTVNLQANSLGIIRTDGQDTQRAFASAQWDYRRITSLGQEFSLTALVRGDAYHSDENADTITGLYAGEEGWQFRGIGAVAADIRWPFVGELFGGIQRVTPRVQIVTTPDLSNLEVPNEDSRSIELENASIFAINRFPGYDRFEDGVRMTYGGEYALDLPRFSLRTSLGQSYRLTRKPTLFPSGTGLSSRFSDVVGRTEIRYGRFLALTSRYRIDKDNLDIRRAELDLTVGSRTTYVELGYLLLDRDITLNIEDLRDREELRAAARVAIGDYWSVFGSAVVDLTSRREDPLSLADGFDPVRTRLGFGYEDEGLEFGFTWRRDYDDTGDARRGDTFLFRVALRNLGR
ncbi:MAG: LPS assembly protein LptD [Parasphingopyxis sp.]|uniref:LPS-assembly protein LptD n=1 Tax=Parasphingopyxis sp. TaxID=1920299 RepID=UPI0032EC6D93